MIIPLMTKWCAVRMFQQMYRNRQGHVADIASRLNKPSIGLRISGYKEDEEVPGWKNQCRRLLLEAGADPTLAPDGVSNSDSFLETVLFMGTRVLINREMLRSHR